MGLKGLVPVPRAALQHIASSLIGPHLRAHHHPPWMQLCGKCASPVCHIDPNIGPGNVCPDSPGASHALDITQSLTLNADGISGDIFFPLPQINLATGCSHLKIDFFVASGKLTSGKAGAAHRAAVVCWLLFSADILPGPREKYFQDSGRLSASLSLV